MNLERFERLQATEAAQRRDATAQWHNGAMVMQMEHMERAARTSTALLCAAEADGLRLRGPIVAEQCADRCTLVFTERRERLELHESEARRDLSTTWLHMSQQTELRCRQVLCRVTLRQVCVARLRVSRCGSGDPKGVLNSIKCRSSVCQAVLMR